LEKLNHIQGPSKIKNQSSIEPNINIKTQRSFKNNSEADLWIKIRAKAKNVS
jgi:hypothetical protein